MSRMLLSIKPQYVDKIISGTKKFEFRKFRCRSDVDTIVIYATNPIKQVIGEAPLLGVIEGDIESVWKQLLRKIIKNIIKIKLLPLRTLWAR